MLLTISDKKALVIIIKKPNSDINEMSKSDLERTKHIGRKDVNVNY